MNGIQRQWFAASQDPRPRELGEGEPAAGQHRSYRNKVLEDYFCVECGDWWPCLPYREAMTCRCSHSAELHDESGRCDIVVCGCVRLRMRGLS